MPVLFTNNASTTLASGITAVATSITVATGQGALFPTISGGNFFYATLANSSNVLEIVKVTARSGDVMTVVRGQDNTTATAYNTGDKFELRPTAASLAWKVDQDFTGTLSGALTLSGNNTYSGTAGFSNTVTFSGSTVLNGTLSGTGLSTYLASPAAIGSSTPQNGTFLVLTANTSLTTTYLTVNGNTVPANGVYLPSANQLGFSSNTTARGNVSSTGAWTLNSPSAGSVTLTVAGVSGTHSTKIADAAAASFNAGYLETPVNTQSAAYTAVLADSGKTIYYTGSTAIALTIPANASVAYPVGTVLTFVNDASAAVSVTIPITTDTLQWVSGGTTGTRTLARYGMATAVKVTSTKWVISGSGLS